jgi:hypothetical protein
MQKCPQCSSQFEITDSDRRFYRKMDVPEPTLCPICRYQRRLAWRNERSLYKRKCDMSGKEIFSIYPADAPFPVISPEVWHGDNWDPCDYGQNFDFNRPFFEQFAELQNKVPRISIAVSNNINCDYCNTIAECKNCYLIFGSIECEDCMYGTPFKCKSCLDTLLTRNSEWCYECTDCDKCYECFYCQDCVNSRNLQFCFDLEGCQNCFLCAGLRQKRFNIMNEQLTEEEYKKRASELFKKSPLHLMAELQELKKKYPQKYMVGVNNENVTGDHVFNSKNCGDLFYSHGCEDVSYSTQIMDCHNCMDCDNSEMANFGYEIMGFYKAGNLRFCHISWDGLSDLMYCSNCAYNTKNCFGCISLQHKQYCILNKQYSKQEYEKLLPRVIEHMKKTGEWGEFFPIENSLFGYNETIAQDFFPLTKEEVLSRGWKWTDKKEPSYGNTKIIPAEKLPNRIQDIPDDILNWAIRCEATGKVFKIQPQELKFYRRLNLPIPHFHQDERHLRRLALRNSRKLYDRNCAKCGTEIRTSYPPDRPEKVYCEQCYLKEVY